MIKQTPEQSGFALVISIVVASIVLAIGLTMLNITIKQLTLASVARESNMAFHAASAGTDCIRYWRLERADEYTEEKTTAVTNAPNINCFSQAPADQNYREESRIHKNGGNYTNRFEYQMDWSHDTDNYCTDIEMYVMVAGDSDYTIDFDARNISTALGDGGVKECLENDVCTALIVRGYNRACNQLDSLLTVEREITTQF